MGRIPRPVLTSSRSPPESKVKLKASGKRSSGRASPGTRLRSTETSTEILDTYLLRLHMHLQAWRIARDYGLRPRSCLEIPSMSSSTCLQPGQAMSLGNIKQDKKP